MFNRLLVIIMLPMLISGETSAYKFFIKFKDKKHSSYSISDPSDYLSQKAIDRRLNQNIQFGENDLPVTPIYLDSILYTGARILYPSKWLNGVSIECDSTILAEVQKLSCVVEVILISNPDLTKDRKVKKLLDNSQMLVNSGMLRTQNFDYGNSFNQIHLMNGEFLHDQGYTATGITIAVLDAGFLKVDQLQAFDSLRNQNGILGTWDFVQTEAPVYEDHSHGMQVLSCMAGNIPGQLIGTAPGASFWLLRTEDAATEYLIEEYNWVAGAEFADSVGVDIITSSLGYTTFDDPGMDHSYADMDGNTTPASIGADIAASKGILVINSAGNNGTSSWHYISTPSDADSALCIAAVDEFGIKASFSSWGPSSDGDLKPNVAAKGQQASIANVSGTIGTGNGTSFACPILAGSAACLWQAHPAKSSMEIFRAIEQSANYYLTPGDSLGYGIPNFMLADFILKDTVDNPGVVILEDVLLGIYPNPFHETIEFQFLSAVSEELEIEVIDAIGRIVLSRKYYVSKGTINTIRIPSFSTVQSLPPVSSIQQGIYLLNIKGRDNNFSRKLIKY